MPAINSGTLELIKKGELPSHILAYKRKLQNEEVLVMMNFSKHEKIFSLNETWQRIFSINKEDNLANGKISLSQYGAVILKK